MRPLSRTLAVLFLIITVFPNIAIFPNIAVFSAEPRPKAEEFLRIRREEGKKRLKSLDTAIVTYEGKYRKKPVRVDLISAVHIADPEYYEELNKQFRGYDSVLFELVLPKGVKIDEKTLQKSSREERKNLLSTVQNDMSTTLSLVHQLDHVDYTAKNFIHADLSAEDFFQRMSDRGDLANMFSRVMLHGLSKESEEKGAKMQGRLFASLFSRNKSLSLKRIFAQELVSQMQDSLWMLSGEDGSAIISDRNEIALKKLRERLKKGERNIAIFYGGGHLPEMAQCLEDDFSLKKTATRWIVAWDLTSDRSARKP